VAVLIGAFFVGAGVQYIENRLTAYIVRRKEPKLTALVILIKVRLWAGLIMGALHWSYQVLLSSIAGCAVFTFAYAIAHYAAARKGDGKDVNRG